MEKVIKETLDIWIKEQAEKNLRYGVLSVKVFEQIAAMFYLIGYDKGKEEKEKENKS